MDLSVSVPPPSCSEGVCPPKQKTKTLCVFEVLGPVPPSLTGIHTQNAVKCERVRWSLHLEQLAQDVRPQGRSWRHVPEAPRAAPEWLR